MKQMTRISLLLTATAFLWSGWPVQAAYVTGGWVRAVASPTNLNQRDPEVAQPYSSNTAVASGNAGAYAEARYFASLPSASVGVYATSVAGAPVAAQADAEGLFRDVLHFTVPAGYYQNPVEVVLSGHLSGTLSGSSSGPEGLVLSAVFSITDDKLTDSFDPVYTSAGTYADAFQIRSELVPAGTTLSSPTTVSRTVSGMLLSRMRAPSPGDSVEGDFFSTGSFNAVEVPAGISWQSDSGVFLIPEPSIVVMLLMGLASLAWGRKTHRKSRF